MANRYPLILDTTDGNKIKELPAGDNLTLRDSSILDVKNINALGVINAPVITVNGQKLVAQNFADLTDTPSTFVGSENYFVKVNATGSGIEFRPLSDLENIGVTNITTTGNILPAVNGVGTIGSVAFKYNRIVANSLSGNLTSYDGSIVFNATNGKISYSALEGAPGFLSEFQDDVGYLRQADLDASIAGLFDEGRQFVTDIQGSVFGDDSVLLVDGVAGKIVGDVENNSVITGRVKSQDDIDLYVFAGGTGAVILAGQSDLSIGHTSGQTDIYGDVEFNNGTTAFQSGNDVSFNCPVKFTQSAPASSIGVDGDLQGAVAFDSNYIYYCTADYDGVTNIWKRVAWSGDTW